MSEKRPLIAVASYTDKGFGPWQPSTNYTNALYATGSMGFLTGPVMTDEDAETIYQMFDGLVLTGGADINAEFLGEEPHEKCHFAARERDLTEMRLAKRFMAGNKPILAICRGEQLLNLVMGGAHDQHIFDRPEVNIEHANGETRHAVNVMPGTLLADIFDGAETLTVNSTHHQAVKTLAPCFTLTAMSPDGVIEGYCMGDRVLATQWHPERLLDEGMKPLWIWFKNKCLSVKDSFLGEAVSRRLTDEG